MTAAVNSAAIRFLLFNSILNSSFLLLLLIYVNSLILDTGWSFQQLKESIKKGTTVSDCSSWSLFRLYAIYCTL